MLGIPLLWLVGCDRAAVDRAREARELGALTESVGAYWQALRWSDGATAAQYHPSADAKLALTELMAEPTFKLTEVSVLQIALDPRPADPAPDWVRGGAVLLRVEAVDGTRNKVVTETVSQRWENPGGSWVIDDEQTPMRADRPW